jgi:hypothetical protein
MTQAVVETVTSGMAQAVMATVMIAAGAACCGLAARLAWSDRRLAQDLLRRAPSSP